MSVAAMLAARWKAVTHVGGSGWRLTGTGTGGHPAQDSVLGVWVGDSPSPALTSFTFNGKMSVTCGTQGPRQDVSSAASRPWLGTQPALAVLLARIREASGSLHCPL